MISVYSHRLLIINETPLGWTLSARLWNKTDIISAMRELSMVGKRNMKEVTLGGVPLMVPQKRIQLGTMRLRVRSLASLSGLRIQCSCELWCRSQTPFRSGIAVAVV